MGPGSPLPTHLLKLLVAPQTVSFLQPSTFGYFLCFCAARLFLPLSLRDLMTLRPPLVLILIRKP